MTRNATIASFTILAILAAPALAWGPHPDIGMAGLKVLDKDDPFRAWMGGNAGLVGNLSWWNDMAGGAAIMGVGEYRVYTRDCFEIPGFGKNTGYAGHGAPELGTYEAFFGRLLQAMHTETTAASMGWLGAVLHDAEDTGAPPHSGKAFAGPQHGPMETWVDSSKIDIAGYKPRLLGKTEEEATKGYAKRLTDLHEYSLERAKKIFPLAQAKDRAAAEPMILECANESARAVADVLHTLGYLQSQMKPVAGAAGLAGTISAPANPDRLTARIMLKGTKYSTFADLKGRYEFRNLPPGKYTAIVMMPRCKPQMFEAELAADKQSVKDLTLEENGNLLRNGGLTVQWAREGQPDGWRAYQTKEKLWNITSEPVFLKPGQKVQVKIAWRKGAEGKADITWDGRRWDDKRAITAESDTITATAPEGKRSIEACIVLQSKEELAGTIEGISVTVEKE